MNKIYAYIIVLLHCLAIVSLQANSEATRDLFVAIDKCDPQLMQSAFARKADVNAYHETKGCTPLIALMEKMVPHMNLHSEETYHSIKKRSIVLGLTVGTITALGSLLFCACAPSNANSSDVGAVVAMAICFSCFAGGFTSLVAYVCCTQEKDKTSVYYQMIELLLNHPEFDAYRADDQTGKTIFTVINEILNPQPYVFDHVLYNQYGSITDSEQFVKYRIAINNHSYVVPRDVYGRLREFSYNMKKLLKIA